MLSRVCVSFRPSPRSRRKPVRQQRVPDAAIHENGPTEPRLAQAETLRWCWSVYQNSGTAGVFAEDLLFKSSKFSYSDFVPLPRVGDLSLSEPTDPSVKHVGSVQLTRVNFEERKLPKRFSITQQGLLVKKLKH
jgi:hypothetical protein